MNYPGHIIKENDTEKDVVKAIQQQLNVKNYGPLTVDGNFGPKTLAAVIKFQTNNKDANGNPLTPDGKIGPLTWAALFAPVAATISALLKTVLQFAAGELGVMEDPLGSNNGARVNQYQDAAGEAHGTAWCVSFIYWCFKQTANQLGVANPMDKTGGVIDLWDNATKKITAASAAADPSQIKAGQIFCISTNEGTGHHAGLTEQVNGNVLTTIEGNTNDNGSSEGIGVFRHTTRTIGKINIGFVQY